MSIDLRLAKQITKIAAELHAVQKRLRAVETTAQGTHRSVTGGATTYYDDEGNVRQIIGIQDDGTYTTMDVNAPPPPEPSAPIVTARPGVLVITWDGYAYGGTLWPNDFARIDVHMSTQSNFTPSEVTVVASFTSLSGGTATFALDQIDYYTKFVAVNTSGVESVPSNEVDAVPLAVATANGIQTYYEPHDSNGNGPIGLTASDNGDIWFDTADGNHAYRWNGSTLTWDDAQDLAINTAQATADAKMAIYYSDTAPTTNYMGNPLGSADIGALWYDTANGNHPYRYNGNADPTLAWDDMQDTAAAAAYQAATTDGQPPAESPEPQLIGSVGAIFVRWDPITNHDPVTYQVHISATDNFTPDGTTLVVSTVGGMAVIRNLPDGTPLQYNTTYYVILVAWDDDGAAPASTAVSGSMVQATSADIAADYAYVGYLSASYITAGTLNNEITLSSKIKTGDTGARVELDNKGLRLYDSTGAIKTILGSDGQAKFTGNVETSSLTIQDGLALRGNLTNEMSQGAKLFMRSGTTASSSAPAVGITYQQQQFLGPDAQPTTYSLGSIFWDSSLGQWLVSDCDSAVYHTWNPDGTYGAAHSITRQVSQLVKINPTGTEDEYWGTIYDQASAGGVWHLLRLNKDVTYSDDMTTLTNWTQTPDSSRPNAIVADATGTHITASDDQVSLVSKSYNIKNGSVSGKVSFANKTSNASGSLIFRDGSGNTSWPMTIKGATLTVNNNTSFTYDQTQHAYLRIAESSGNFYFQTSPDKKIWTTLAIVAHGLSDANLNGTYEWNAQSYAKANMISNWGFNSNLNGWQAMSGSTISRTTSTVFDGAASMKVTTSGTDGRAQTTSQYNISNASTGVVRLRFTSKWDGGAFTGNAYPRLQIWFYDSSGNQVGANHQDGGTYFLTNWATLTHDFTVPAGAVYAQMGVYVMSIGNYAGYIDDVYLAPVQGAFTMTITDDEEAKPDIHYPIVGASNGQPAIGVQDNTHIGAVYYTPAAGSTAASYSIKVFDVTNIKNNTTGVLYPSEPYGTVDAVAAVYGKFDSGGTNNRWTVLLRDTTAFVTADQSGTYSRRSGEDFASAPSGATALGWDGSNFYSLNGSGLMTQYTGITTNADWDMAFSWSDGGSQETTLSTATVFTVTPRSQIVITTPEIPSTATQIIVYGRPDSISNPPYYEQGSSTTNTLVLSSLAASGAQPKTSNTFSGSTPAIIQNDDDSLHIGADGTVNYTTGSLSGDLTVHGDFTAFGGLHQLGGLTEVGDLSASGNITSTGNTTVGGDLHVTGAVNITPPYLNLASQSVQLVTNNTTAVRSGYSTSAPGYQNTGFTGLGGGVYSPTAAGVYVIKGVMAMQGTSSTNVRFYVQVRVNGTPIHTRSTVMGNRYETLGFDLDWRLAAGDSVDILLGAQGADLSTVGDYQYNQLMMRRVSS